MHYFNKYILFLLIAFILSFNACRGGSNNEDVTGVSLDKTTVDLVVGETGQLTASISPANASNQNLQWASSDSSKVTIDANGLATAVANGWATITVTTEDGGFSAESVVIVENVPDTTFWDSVKSSASPGVEFPAEYGTPTIQNNATLGWEDGVFISRDGLYLFAFYAPVDIIKFSEYFGAHPYCFNIAPFLRGPTLGINFDYQEPFSNPGSCTEGFMHSDIAVASRTSTSEDFSDWGISDASVDFQYDGGYQASSNGLGGYDIIFSRSTTDNKNDLYWIRDASSIDPVALTVTALPSPVNTTEQEDNPHLERLNTNNLVLLFDNHGVGDPDTEIKYSHSTDNGASWSTPQLLSTINSATYEDMHGHLWNDGSDWWLYFTSNRNDAFGLKEIFRSKHNSNDLVNDFDNWGTPELVISRGTIPGMDSDAYIASVGDPTLTANGDISFVVSYCRVDTVGYDYDTCEIDPWFLPRN